MESAQRYPEDFDAITAGAVANDMARLQAHGLMALTAQANPPDALPASKIPLIHDAAVAACDLDDGLADGVISDPFRCDFDPGVLACEAGAATDACLTPRELQGARMMYEGAHNPRTGELIYPPALPGSEAQWPYHVGDETIAFSREEGGGEDRAAAAAASHCRHTSARNPVPARASSSSVSPGREP